MTDIAPPSARLVHEPEQLESLAQRLAAWCATEPAPSPLDRAFLQAMLDRAQQLRGPVQERVLARLDDLLSAREARAASPALEAVHQTQAAPTTAASVRPTGLAALVEQLTRSSVPPPTADRPSATDDALASLGGPPDLKAMGYFRSTWSRLSAERRLTQSLARVPDNAGPLNAQHLVHRTLNLMCELSPAYLQHFLDYADTLMWLERAQTPSAEDAAPARSAANKGKSTSARKPAVKRSRSR